MLPAVAMDMCYGLVDPLKVDKLIIVMLFEAQPYTKTDSIVAKHLY